MLHLLNAEMPLGLSFEEILLHLLNFSILLIGVRFLLWKPIKKFMDKRRAEYSAIEEKTNNSNKEALELKKKYQNFLDEAEIEKAKIIKDTSNDAKINAENILKDAKIQAQEIIENSKKTALNESLKVKKELESEVIGLSVGIAGKILDREIKEKDNSKLIDDCLEEWKKI